MSSDAADRGVKPPRTLFSLGRPGAKQDAGPGEPAEAPTDAAEEDEGELLFACGACGAILPGGAAFCGECGTPIDTSAYDDYPIEDEPLPVGSTSDTVVLAAPDTAPRSSDTVVLPSPESDSDGANDGSPISDAEEIAAPVDAAGVTTDLPAADHNATVNVSAAAMAGAMAQARDGAGETRTDATPSIDDATTQEMPAVSVPDDAAGADLAPVDPAPVELASSVPAPVEVGGALAPAATLYADPSTAEPLGLESSGQWVSDPSMGHVSTDEPVQAATATAAGAGAGATIGASAAAPPVAPPPSGTTATSMPYGSGPVESSEKSKVPMIAGIAAGVVVLLILAVVILSGGSKDSGSVASGDSSTTFRPVNTSTTVAPATTATTAKGATTSTSTKDTTTSTEAPTSTTAPPDTTASTPAPTLPPTLPPITLPPVTTRPIIITTTTPGTPNLSFNATNLTVAQGGSGTLNLANSGNGPGGFLCSPKDSITVSPASGTVPAGNSIQITFTDQNKPGRFAKINCSLPNGNVEITVGVS